jgi:hypothetical protein
LVVHHLKHEIYFNAPFVGNLSTVGNAEGTEKKAKTDQAPFARTQALKHPGQFPAVENSTGAT